MEFVKLNCILFFPLKECNFLTIFLKGAIIRVKGAEYMGLEAIDRIRREKKMSLKVLAEKSGVPIGTLSKINAGFTKDPKLETIKAIVKALDCKLEDLDAKNSTPAKSESAEMDILLNKFRQLTAKGQDEMLNYLEYIASKERQDNK